MNIGDRHIEYDRERRADLIREARRKELAAALATERRAERRSFLARAWARRSRRAPAPADVPEAPAVRVP